MRDVIARIPHRHAALLPSEALAFVCVALSQKCDALIESGRKFGYSTECLAASGIRTVSVDRHPIPVEDERFRGRVELFTGDGQDWVPKLARRYSRPAILLDGPKGVRAYGMLDRLDAESVCVAIHDAHPGSFIERVDRPYSCTNTPGFLGTVGQLDDGALKYRGFEDHDHMLAVANGLAFFVCGKAQ